jgi:hypothetical protein
MWAAMRFVGLSAVLAVCFAAPMGAGSVATGHDHVAARQLTIEPVKPSDSADDDGKSKKKHDKDSKDKDNKESAADKAMDKAEEELIAAKKDKIAELQQEIKDDQKNLKQKNSNRNTKSSIGTLSKLETQAGDGDNWGKEESEQSDASDDEAKDMGDADKPAAEAQKPGGSKKTQPWNAKGLTEADKKIMMAKDHLKKAQKMKIEELQKALQGLGGMKARR